MRHRCLRTSLARVTSFSPSTTRYATKYKLLWRFLFSFGSCVSLFLILAPCINIHNFAVVMVYSIIILVMAIIASTRGNSPWTSTVKHGNFLAPATGAQSGNGAAAQAPIMHQHQYPPTQSSSGATPPPLQGSYTGVAEVSELPHEGTSYA